MYQLHHDTKLAAERQQELINEAELARMVALSSTTQAGWLSALLYNVGSALVVTGTRLKSRYEDAQGADVSGLREVYND